MKAAILSALLALTPVGQTIITTAGGVFVVQTDTVVSHENRVGSLQVEAMVHLSIPEGVSVNRVGVVGCAAGRGQIGRVAEDGEPLGTPVAWAAGGTKVHDVLAESICLAHAASSHAKSLKGMV